VSFYAGGEVLCGADVETAVSARKDVDVVHLNAGPRLVLWSLARGPFDSSYDAFMARHERALCGSRIRRTRVPRQARGTIRLEP
jgi:hypothetical protein